jgi:non-ribosomal peptide synthetase component E (peptide arylation enzyme)
VVAAPDSRLGEHAAAFFRMANTDDGESGEVPSLEAVRAALGGAGLAKPKWPEELHAVADFPRTPSGKIQKFVLRQRLRDAAS